MADYSVKVCEQLAEKFRETDLRRPMHVGRYDAGTVLTYEVTGVAPSYNAKVTAEIEKFVGGGFAGQVYRVKILKVDSPQGSIEGLEVGAVLAMKILIPPSGFSLAFRNAVYGVGFQGPFQLQVNPDAARAGALLQKFIRRAAKIRFGSENCVNDILGTFVDSTLGSCGEFSYWIDGRTWRLEVDDHLHLLKPWKKGQDVDQKDLGSPEYRNKFTFMNDFVEMLHEMGAPEFARQYEWSTCKSQPNCLKRTESGDDPEDGLVAVDFRAGLALLPFLPMSPGDFKLIWHGIKRGSLVQFDRGDLGKLKQYMDDHADDFADLRDAYKELERTEKIYRDSLPDITHNGVRLLTDSSLRDQIFKSTVTGWRVRNLIDEKAANLLYRSKFLTLLFFMLGILGRIGSLSLVVGAVTALYITGAALIGHGQGKGLLFTIAVVGLHTGLFLSGLTCLLRGLWGRHDLREHFILCFTSWSYFRRTLRGRMMERLILWHRDGRISEQRAAELSEQSMRYLRYLIISGLPVGLFRMVTDLSFLKERLHYIVVRPVKLYFDAEMREQWLRDMVTQGKKNHIITDEDANVILGQISEPYIQKYLKSLAVHVCTLPVTQIVSVIVALIYWLLNKDTDPNAWAKGLGIIALFQVVPLSPGSLCRGMYVLYLVIKERNFKDYNIAVFLGFFKYIGYLAFPIQMAYRYPVMARFMAGHWATEAVHIVPVFGEKGALLEHKIFGLFYNLPLTLRRRMGRRAELRSSLAPRRWHVLPTALMGAGLLSVWQYFTYCATSDSYPWLGDMKIMALVISLLCGMAVTLAAGGLTFGRRIVLASIGGVALGITHGLTYLALAHLLRPAPEQLKTVETFIWGIFAFTIFSTIGAIITELKLPEPKTR